MTEYIATFFSHFGATVFARMLRERGLPNRTMPVPRRISSSCGSCVRFAAADPLALCTPEVEGIYTLAGEVLWRAEA